MFFSLTRIGVTNWKHFSYARLSILVLSWRFHLLLYNIGRIEDDLCLTSTVLQEVLIFGGELVYQLNGHSIIGLNSSLNVLLVAFRR